MISAEADGTTSIAACLFWMVNLTVILRPFQSPVALAMSSPTFLGDRPRGPILGARADVAPTSPPVHLMYTTLTSRGRIWEACCCCCGRAAVLQIAVVVVRVSDEP